MSTLQDRITEVMVKTGLTVGEIAAIAQVSSSAVTQWKDGPTQTIKTAPATRLAERTGFSALWLATGQGEMLTPSIQTSNVKFSGVDPVDLAFTGGVPLISWVCAGSFSDAADPYVVGDAEDWLPCPVRHGPRTYCLRVRGDSMYNPGGRPSYADGDIIFVDPDRRANPGDRVIVRLDDHAEATFKQLLIEDGRKLLKALNPEWAPRYIEINGNATIAGVIIGKRVPE